MKETIKIKEANMTRDELSRFMYTLNSYNNIDYLFSIIACGAAPTLAKQKPSSLLIFSNNNRNLQNTWEEFKNELKDKLNVKFVELKKSKKNTVVLFYNEKKLKEIIRDEKNIEFLKRFGYNTKMKLEEYLLFLGKRFEDICPHEIGIFLGYPVEDVAMFIDCPNKKCKMIGYWKVYHNIEEAKKTFTKYDQIKSNIIKLMIEGIKPTEILRYECIL